MASNAHTQAHGKASPCSHAADHQQIAAHIDWRLTLIAYSALHLITYN